ncbi:maleylpyruvate isomerase family mycothiol-dependent enzyme [Cellulomonas denverensis]|uniref:Maleylpyruvate isomerase family mycothiol-dependent enzyme n=1 Tax=Cellulomonas denverensis TaxID=264297 RepID=A0A7X6R009_9CELL|nr:maleylpyruvate isomerase family mycothiol-dependent enzyme [Cellulomonas denverensis]NKY23677.1 maleylpyruvate isomerase family mycothiol-dependent enzyme [Cellulomonas denverensis]GIG26980.1 hypothetical protein Cde04nite_32240 [Cellulomonas denverensis]
MSGRADHTPLAPDAWLPALRTAQTAFADLLADADPGAVVPACAPWTVADLARHLANIHRWAAGMAAWIDGLDEDDTAGPHDPAALRDFYRDCATLLRSTLDHLGPDAPAYTLNGPGPAAFWHRRQLHETLVHVADLAAATGRPHPVTDPVLWADCVDEVITVMAPRQLRLARITAAAHPVAVHATDTGHHWVLDLTDPGARAVPATGRAPSVRKPSHDGEASGARELSNADEASSADEPSSARVPNPVAALVGPADRLALLLWRRTTPDDPGLTLTGDRDAALAALDRALVP